jgi:hypothetical protein
MRTMEYNGTGQKSYTKKKTESLGNWKSRYSSEQNGLLVNQA